MADHPENRPPIQIKPVHSSISYQQATYQKYDRRGRESPSGYGALVKNIIVIMNHSGIIEYSYLYLNRDICSIIKTLGAESILLFYLMFYIGCILGVGAC